jgi:hypothetical protein
LGKEGRICVCQFLCVLGIVPGRTQALIGVWFELTRVIGLHKRDIRREWRFFGGCFCYECQCG